MSPSRDSDETHVQNGHTNHDNAEKGKKQSEQDQEPSQVGFWDKSLKSVRLDVFKNVALTTLILCVFILTILSLYWAVLFHAEQNSKALKIWVVDFDSQVAPYTSTTPLVGPQLVQAALMQNEMPSHLGFQSRAISDFGSDPMEVRRQIYDQKAWAAIIVNANATTLLREAVNSGNASFDPLGIAQIIYVQARDETTYDQYVTPMLNKFQTEFTSMFGEQWAKQVLQNASSDATLLANIQNAPQAVNPAVGFSMFNLRPFTPAAATPSVTIGLIYLIIIAFFSFSFYMPHHMKFLTPSSKTSKKTLKFPQLIIWRIFVSFTAYFFLSLFYSFVSLAFQINFTAPPGSHTEVVSPATGYGRASFVVFWVLNWVGMGALGLACENVAMIVGQPWAALWLIFWVITNVSTSFYNLDLAPRFYHWGYAWPLHNIVEADRAILFNVHSRVPQNFGILLGWVVVNIFLFPFCCYFMRWKTQRGQRKEKEKKEKDEE